MKSKNNENSFINRATKLKPSVFQDSSFTPPIDWPEEGKINLEIHDLPHQSSSTEWWYFNSHLVTDDGSEYSFFTSFFRKLFQIDDKTDADYSHSLLWGMADLTKHKYNIVSLVDPKAPQIGIKLIKKGKLLEDPLFKKATIELLKQNKVPLPDKLMEHPPIVHKNKLHLDFDGNKFIKLENGNYLLKTFDESQNIGFDLRFTLKKPPIRHGDNGLVGGSSEDMFYYFIPSCEVQGSVIVDGEVKSIESGKGWYDHEFGTFKENTRKSFVPLGEISWNWTSIQLNNGYEIAAYDWIENETGAQCGHLITIIDPNGGIIKTSEFSFIPQNSWTSMYTFRSYPTLWKLEVPSLEIELQLQAAFSAQEFRTVVSKRAFWEGRMNIKGKMNGNCVEGLGFVERNGFVEFSGMDEFFKAVGKCTRESVYDILPLNPNKVQASRLVLGKDQSHYLDGIDLNQYNETFVKPIRYIVDLKGKAWRSFVLLVCCSAVGGNPQEFESWLALPELLQVGAIIIDDIEDKSVSRRGGQACHIKYGEALSINAGNACYFLGHDLIHNAKMLTGEKKLELYNLYFKILCAGHSGQAIDIDGLNNALNEVVHSGESKSLEDQIKAIHLLKTAVPVGYLSRMGVVIGNGSKKEEEALCAYMEAVGMAFQIMDDVLNLKGFKSDRKDKGEDIKHGKVTFPIVKAMGKLGFDDRIEISNILTAKTENFDLIEKAINIIDGCGALLDCEKDASELVESRWKQLDSILDDSHAKLMLRAFGWFVLQRKY